MKQMGGAIGANSEEDTHSQHSQMVTPLRKRRLTGELYERSAQVEALVVELSALPREEMIARAAISKDTDPRYVPSECLVYFIRQSRRDNNETWFEVLYRILIERVLRSLPKADGPGGKTESLTRGNVREKVVGRFAELLSEDRAECVDKLDFFEVRFAGAMKKLLLDAQKKAWRDEKRSQTLDFDEESGELSPEIEAAAGAYDPFSAEFEDRSYRLRLDAAIDALLPEQRTIIQMLRQDFPIDSKEPGVMTIAKAVGRSEKTVRTYRDKAYATLRAAMTDGDDR